jgi:alpha-glucosidase (family GH31 glycosyl hydrolase)
MTRALVIEYQNDPNVWNIGSEFLFGDSLLVAPITDEKNKRVLYLPEGIWTDWWTGERIEGGKWMNIEVDIETLPLYIREGGIIPMGPIMNYVDEIKTNQINLRISMFESDGRSSFSIPVDNQKIFVEYTSSNGNHSVNISKTDVNIIIESFGKENKKLAVIKE